MGRESEGALRLRAVFGPVNKVLAMNRLGRGTAAFFLLLSLCTLGTELSIVYQLVLAHTASQTSSLTPGCR